MTKVMNFKCSTFQVLLFCVLAYHANKGVTLSVNDSEEYKLRQELLRNMDVMVRPVTSSSDAVNVSFSLTVWALADLESKRQMLLTSVWISQKWNNPFLVWDKDKYGGIDRIHVSSKEIWVPDIVLYNNGDKQVLQAGHTEIFKNWVVLNNDGSCNWESPANIESRCNVEISSFPFDEQQCYLLFGSATYGSESLRIHSIHPGDECQPTKEKLHNNNGEWEIECLNETMYLSAMEQRVNSAQKYSFAKYSLKIKRRPLYYIMLLIVPCVLCTMLVLISFAIPPENGERIGFCATIMISVSFYLIIMTDMLPEKSDTLPILGIYYTITMVEIAAALMATILVLRVYHSVSEPPACFKALCRVRKPKPKKGIERASKLKLKKFLSKRNAVANDITIVGDDADVTAHVPVQVDPEEKPVVLNEDNECAEDDNRKVWRAVAVACDRFFFWLFLIMFLASTGYLMKFRPIFRF
ncbi:neuronal acetylcholine receptor subunit alpha-5-like isoform X2 [Orbicella faveolata]|uniref:neuronal acetylcholine receptor subunit alpha-5-like isoform X2 n=1 Tax=Orbicella faveolata TaxID=48498 RepID=UPI0009E348C6|nr:neuronal acetylcholine receptor subunit alpha-5-like isoform X2 [Orbicella faveolata]